MTVSKVTHIKKPGQHIIIEAIEKANGLVKPAAISLNITRRTLYTWIQKDEELQNVQMQCREALLDLVESKLFINIQNNDTTSIIFALKTIGKHRGYVERTEHEHSGGVTIKPIDWVGDDQ